MGKFTRYELQEKIGVGGMAEAFLAYAFEADGRATRVVVKKILPHLSQDVEHREMLMDEARIASVLDHPNIVRLLDFGRMDDQLFIAIEFVDGADVGALIEPEARRPGDPATVPENGRPADLGCSLVVILDVLDALEHAHTRTRSDGTPMGIVHRDVSPGNILVSKDGVAKLGDFGIAFAKDRVAKTRIGMVKGNIFSTAPEQLEGDEVDARADVYATGLLLHTLLIGKHPLAHVTIREAVFLHTQGKLPKPSEFNRDVPAALDALIRQASALKVEERLPSAGKFAEALRDLAHTHGIELDRAQVREWVLDGIARRPSAAPPVPSLVIRVDRLIEDAMGEPTPEGPSLFSSGPRAITPIEPSGETTATAPTPSVDHEAMQPAPPPWASQSWFLGEPDRKPAEAAPAAPRVPGVALDVSQVTGRDTVPGDPPDATETATSPGPRLERFAEPTGELGGHRGAITSLALSGRRAVSGSNDWSVRVWDLASGKETVALRGNDAPVTAVALGDRAGVIVTGARDGTVRQWKTESWERGRTRKSHDGWVFSIAVDSEGTIVAGGDDKIIRIWKGGAAEPLLLLGHGDCVSAVALLDDGRLVTGSYDRTLRVLDAGSGATKLQMRGEMDRIRCMAVDPGRRRALTGTSDGSLWMWDLAEGKLLFRVRAHEEPVVATAFLANGRFGLSGSYDGALRLWDLAHGEEAGRIEAGEAILAIATTDDGTILAATGNVIRLWKSSLR